MLEEKIKMLADAISANTEVLGRYCDIMERVVANAQDAAQPLRAEEPTAQPVKAEEPTAQPLQAEEPTAQPLQAEEPTAQPLQAEEPTAQPVKEENHPPLFKKEVSADDLKKKLNELARGKGVDIAMTVAKSASGKPVDEMDVEERALIFERAEELL